MAVTPKKLTIALQGGGAHGAYSWGVLDRLLEDGNIEIEGISGTSAGAMNASVLVDGYMEGGYDGAREALEKFWRRISDFALASPFRQSPLDAWLDRWNLDGNFMYSFFDSLSRFVSPYMFNPMNINPLESILQDTLDIDRMNACSQIKLFVSATRVRDGQPKVFHCGQISIQSILASACLPYIFQAVTIDGEDYWDGGYTGNPAIWPLIYHCKTPDVLLVQVNPVQREGTPMTATEIINRVNEITFNSSLIAEMRAIAFVSKLINEGKLSEDHHKDMRIHMVKRPDEMLKMNASSKLNTDWSFFTRLRDIGREAADQWLRAHREKIGNTSSVDIGATFLNKD